ncbi:ABC transporter substrate-binding protein [Actinophytocola oryzae]|uniref:NitT/TauT family transport system substrate-binding protein n=1 Tax=Actinophytocola oryzae TaxID=502181 RepID=A0A4R7VRH0_9PSEU|nr:ABC transporter substrate-binding protein [Actinophytocola oryzae]TDV52252.1 NitT/TauT family transport system substrate-binding protein [Actinophytocola oryzae]
MKRLLTGLTAAALLVACAPSGQDNDGAGSGSADNGPKETVTFTLNWVPYGEHAPFYYGVQKGFYADEGIDLKIEPGSGSGTTIKSVAQGQTMFGWADTPPLLNAITTGMPVKSVGVFLQKGPASIEFLSDKNIKSIQDLKGKTVGGTPGDAMYATFPALLAANDMQPTDVTVVNMDAANKIAQLAEGQVDAIMGFFHDQGPTIEARTGKKVDHLLFADSGLNMLGTGIVVSDETMSSQKDLVGKFVRATQKSWAEAVKHPEDAAKAMAELAENEPPLEVLVKQLKLAEPLLQLNTAGEPGVNIDMQWSDTIELMSKYSSLKEPGEPSKYWDGSFAKGDGS